MKKRNLQLWRMLILAIVMLAAPMVMAANLPPDVSLLDPSYPTSLYPPGIGFNPVVDYRLPQFAQSPNIRKFVDSLPGLGAANANNLGQYIPVAVPDTKSFPGSDYYEIGLQQYTKKMHSDLPPSKVRGYYQINGPDPSQNYLGPAIIANKDRPVRLKFVNQLNKGAAGNLPLPVDTDVMGAGMGPTAGLMYSQNRANVHLHGGLTPWISDGTPHQWVTPANDTTFGANKAYQKGVSFQNVPDMVNGPTGGVNVVNGITVPCAAKNGAACFTPTATDGIGTYYYPNGQSGRLMFYHDHAYGITRLNVYAGMAAPYLLTDQVEQDLIDGTSDASGVFAAMGIAPTKILPGLGVPLVIQDKTFVNDANTPLAAAKAVFPAPTSLSDTSLVAGAPPVPYVPTPKTLETDPLWAYYTPPYNGSTQLVGGKLVTTGGTPGGNFWIGHEYLPVENPYDPSGNTWNGRWDYGPFMIPAMVPLNLTLPSPTIIPEGFQDTAIVNGTAFPYVELPPEATRFRMLNACNDRSLNLQLYKADPLRINVTDGGSGYSATPTVTINRNGNPGVGGTLPSYTSATATVVDGVITAITVTGAANYSYDPLHVPTVTITDGSGTGAAAVAFVGTEVKMVDAAPNANFPSWPRDGRDGGVPDPATAAPDWLQIGNEAGFLAKVAVTPQQPIDYNYDRQVIPLVGVTSKSLLLMPAMRADVIINLSKYKDGDTLILYNDAPTAMPNYWPINDYFTDDPDNTGTGGAPTTPAGFGPNTRTIMQIRIKASLATGFTFDRPSLVKAIPAAFRVGSDPILVPQVAYNDAYPAGHPLHFTPTATNPDNIVQGYQTTMNISGTPQGVSLIKTVMPGNNYTVPPTVVITGGGGKGATATAGLNPMGGITILTAGTGYTSPPTVTLGAPVPAAAGVTRVQATAIATVSGGMVTAINIVEPGANYTNTLLAPTCTITGGGGTGATCSVMLPTLNTVGSIVITNPGSGYTSQPQVYIVPKNAGALGASADARLAGDIAMTGKNMTEGFDPEYGRMEIRLGSTPNPLTPSVGAGFVIGIARYIDPPTEIMKDGEVILWRLAHLGVDSHAMHFHLFNVQVINHVDWTNVIKPRYDDEIGWRETIRTNPMEDIILAIQPQSMALPWPIPNSVRVLDPTTPVNSTTNFYPVPPPVGVPAVAQQSNVMTNFGWEYVWHCHLLGHEENDMMRPLVLTVTVPAAPTVLLANVVPAGPAAVNVVLNWTNNSANTTGYVVQRSTTNTFTAATTKTFTVMGKPNKTYTDTTASVNSTYYYRVYAMNGAGWSATPSNTATVSTVMPPTGLAATVTAAGATTDTVTVTWAAGANPTSFTVQRTDFVGGTASFTVAGTQRSLVQTGLTKGNTYIYRIRANIAAGSSSYTAPVMVATP